jgi:hypothetical protein
VGSEGKVGVELLQRLVQRLEVRSTEIYRPLQPFVDLHR